MASITFEDPSAATSTNLAGQQFVNRFFRHKFTSNYVYTVPESLVSASVSAMPVVAKDDVLANLATAPLGMDVLDAELLSSHVVFKAERYLTHLKPLAHVLLIAALYPYTRDGQDRRVEIQDQACADRP